jgi:hypothetical protein
MPLDPQLVADHLGLTAPDDRVNRATAAAQAWVQRRRDSGDEVWGEPDFTQGGVLYASLLYQSRAQPEGFPGYSDLGNSETGTGEMMANIFRLVPAAVVTA